MTTRPTNHDPAAVLAEMEWLRRLARALVHDRSIADDMVQETLLAEHQQGEPMPRAWLAGTLRRRIARWYRDRRRSTAREQQVAAQVIAAQKGPPPVEDLLARSEILGRAIAELQQMQEPFRTTLILLFQEGLSVSETAGRLSLPADTVRWRKRRGLEMLRGRLDQADDRSETDWRRCLLPLVGIDAITGVGAISAGVKVPVMKTGGLWMVGKLLVSAVVIVGTFLFASRFVNTPPEVAKTADAAAGIEPTTPLSPVPATPSPVAASADQTETSRREPITTAATAPPPDGVSQLIGRVVDSAGQPLAETVVTHNDEDIETATRTDPEGRFAIDLAPEAAAGTLILEPDVVHRVRQLSLTDHGDFSTPGRHDLGDLVLGGAGQISGRVVDANGVGIEGAWVYRIQPRETVRRRGVSSMFTGADGAFSIGHIPPGEATVLAQAYGYREWRNPLMIDAGSIDTGIEIRLEDSPTLAGRVIDENGSAVAGAPIRATGYWYNWSSETDAAGRFRVSIKDDQPKPIRVDLPGYEPVDGGDTEYEAGSENIEIVMRRLADSTFRVTDAITGGSIPGLHFKVLVHHGAEGIGTLQRETRSSTIEPEGTPIRTHAVPRRDRIAIGAPGYHEEWFTIRDDALSLEGQLIRLSPAARLSGRVVRLGKPVARARVEVYSVDFVMLFPPDDDPMTSPAKIDPALFAGQQPDILEMRNAVAFGLPLPGAARRFWTKPVETTKTDEEGQFAISADVTGAFLIEAHAGDSSTRSRTLRMPAVGPLDVGDISLTGEGRVTGQIHHEGDVDPGSYQVVLDGIYATRPDTEHRFSFDGVGAGVHLIDLRGPGGTTFGAPLSIVRVEAGKTRTLSIQTGVVEEW